MSCMRSPHRGITNTVSTFDLSRTRGNTVTRSDASAGTVRHGFSPFSSPACNLVVCCYLVDAGCFTVECESWTGVSGWQSLLPPQVARGKVFSLLGRHEQVLPSKCKYDLHDDRRLHGRYAGFPRVPRLDEWYGERIHVAYDLSAPASPCVRDVRGLSIIC